MGDVRWYAMARSKVKVKALTLTLDRAIWHTIVYHVVLKVRNSSIFKIYLLCHFP